MIWLYSLDSFGALKAVHFSVASLVLTAAAYWNISNAGLHTECQWRCFYTSQKSVLDPIPKPDCCGSFKKYPVPACYEFKKEFPYKNQAGMIKSWYETDTGLEFGPSLDFKPLDFLRIQLSPQGPVKTRKSASDWLRWWE
jgi:hypothetical protein